MVNNKLVVALLVITILLSAVTIGVALSSDTESAPQQQVVSSGDVSGASVGLVIESNPSSGVQYETN